MKETCHFYDVFVLEFDDSGIFSCKYFFFLEKKKKVQKEKQYKPLVICLFHEISDSGLSVFSSGIVHNTCADAKGLICDENKHKKNHRFGNAQRHGFHRDGRFPHPCRIIS
jgi:hypothetical protein